LPLTECDGLDFSARLHGGNLSNTLQGNIGQSDVQKPHGGGTASTRDSFGFSDTTEYESLTLRLSYQRTRLDIAGVNPLLDKFRLFGPPGIAIADEYESDPKVVITEVIGASYDPGHWFVMSEWGHTKANSFLGDKSAWYVGAGYRVAQFTPYLTYADASATKNSDPGLSLTALPSAQVAVAAGLNAGLNALLQRAIPEQRTITVGARWDFMKNLDLKLQIDHIHPDDDSFGTLTNIQPGLSPGGTVTLFSVALNFVY
jgi:predicted porin